MYFTSWSCATHQMYEAPEPWGPWKIFLSKDFGPLFTPHNYGMYGTSIPSKFISADGKTLYLQSNIWWVNHGKAVWRAYTFALRRVYLEPFQPSTPDNGPSGENLALVPGARAISKSTHFGSLCGLNCSDFIAYGDTLGSEDDFDKWRVGVAMNGRALTTSLRWCMRRVRCRRTADGMRRPLACRFTVIFTGSMSPACA